ncbi:MAG: hypothetical protein EOP06_27895 [Proteobacteria bacterium]|nr:MAG: hypothetical protein EOP06_27895 [Pseudomonadota bacterium]
MNALGGNLFCIFLLTFLAGCEKRQPELESHSSVKSKSKARSEIAQTGSNSDQPVSFEVQKLRSELVVELDSAAAMESQEERERAFTQIAWKSLESVPDLAQRAILLLSPDNSEKVPLLQILVQNMAAHDPNAAISWASALDNEAEKKLAMEQISMMLKESDPEKALELLPTLGTGDERLSPTVEPIISSWASTEPAIALQWLSRRAAPAEQEAGFKVVFQQWLGREPEEAFRWASRQSNAEQRRMAVDAIVKSVDERVEDSRKELLSKVPPALHPEIEKELQRMAVEKEEAQQRAEEQLEAEIRKSEESSDSRTPDQEEQESAPEE